MNRPVLICLVLLATRLIANQTASSGSAAPLWTLDVLQQESSSLGNQTADASIQVPRDSPGVAFLDDNRLMVYEASPTGKLSSRTNPDIRSAFQLHATIIDPISGKLMYTKDWGARPYGSSIQVTGSGILVHTGEVLRVLSHDFSEIHRWTYPEIENTSDPLHCDQRGISVSPTGQTVLVSCYNVKLDSAQLDVWDSTLSESKYSWNETRQASVFLHSYSISDTGIAAMDLRQQNMIVTQFGNTIWDTLDVGTNRPESPVYCANFPTLVTNTWLVNVCSSAFLLVSTDGHVLMSDPLDEMRSPTHPPNRNIAVSQSGQRIAISLDSIDVKKHLGSKETERRVSTHLVVYDLHLRQRVLNLNITPLPERDYDFAISPDGSKLAVLNVRNVSVYSVPLQWPAPKLHEDR